jgi:hypothetical protein
VCIKSWPTVLETCFPLCRLIRWYLGNSWNFVNCIWKFDSVQIRASFNIGLVSQTTTCPFTLRQALPEPKRASKDALVK